MPATQLADKANGLDHLRCGGHPTSDWKLSRLARSTRPFALVMLLWTLPLVARAQFVYTKAAGAITITGYTGPGGALTIPGAIEGLPVRTLGNGAFSGRRDLTSVTIPGSVEKIALNNSSYYPGAFDDCGGLVSIEVDPASARYGSLDGVLFDTWRTQLLKYPEGRAGDYQIPQTVSYIAKAAFSGNAQLGRIFIPASVSSIAVAAFLDCRSLSRIDVDPGNSAFSSEDGVLFDKAKATLILCPVLKSGHYSVPPGVGTIYYGAFLGCARLTGIDLPDSLTFISQDSFSGCAALGTVTIPSRVTTILFSAFKDCVSLTHATIPAGVRDINAGTFVGCVNLRAVYFLGDAPIIPPGTIANATVYYMPGTRGWGPTVEGRPTVLWNPKIATANANFGVRAGKFGFDITGGTNLAVVVEVSEAPGRSSWLPVATNILAGGVYHFSDQQWTNSPSRIYRLRSP